MPTKNRYEKKLNVSTPKGRAAFVYLDRPNMKFDKDGTFQVSLLYDSNDQALRDFEKQLQNFGEEARTDMALGDTPIRLPIKPHKDKDGGFTGEIAVRCKAQAIIKLQDPNGTPRIIETRIAFFDAKKNKIIPAPRVGPGSVLVVGCDAVANYFAGDEPRLYVSLIIRGVQVLDLIEFGTFDPDRYGFEEVEGFEIEAKVSEDDEVPY